MREAFEKGDSAGRPRGAAIRARPRSRVAAVPDQACPGLTLRGPDSTNRRRPGAAPSDRVRRLPHFSRASTSFISVSSGARTESAGCPATGSSDSTTVCNPDLATSISVLSWELLRGCW